MEVREHNSGYFLWNALCLALFLLLGSCRNHSSHPATQPEDIQTTSDNPADNALQAALSKLQKNSASINTLRVPVNGEQVSLLTAAVMLGEDTTAITSLLEKGADIKAADQEINGILHALVSNNKLSDQQKVVLLDAFFDQVDCADDIRTNVSRHFALKRGENPLVRKLSTPWLEALNNGNRQTALKLMDKMSFQQANEDGLYYAIRSDKKFSDFDIGAKNLLRILLDKSDVGHYSIVEPSLKNSIGQDPCSLVRSFLEHKIDVNRSEVAHMPAWQYAWIEKYDVDIAVCIIKKMPCSVHYTSQQEMATKANEVLTNEKNRSREDQASLEEIANEWQSIRNAFIEIGVDVSLLSD